MKEKSDFTQKSNSVLRLSEKETIPFPREIAEITDTLEFQRLRELSQLGITDLIYPSATHTRFSHSLGVYSKCLQYIANLQKDQRFREHYTREDINSLIFAALLHDVGHYPFAHYIEEIGGLHTLEVHHEPFSKRIITGDLSVKTELDTRYTDNYFTPKKARNYRKKATEKIGLSQIIRQHEATSGISEVFRGTGKFRLLKDIIDGPIDCDKLDYLTRDSNSAGVPYGNMIDLNRFYQALTLNTENTPDIRLAITSKGISAVESIISSRYELFSDVYWHKTCRSATAMIKEAFWYARKQITQEEFEWAVIMLNDSHFLEWIYEKIENEDIAYDLLGNIRIFHDRNIYKRIRTYSSLWKEDDKIEMYHLFTTRLQNDFPRIHAYKEQLIRTINELGKTRHNWQPIKLHHIIIDIPNVHQDKYHHIRVSYSNPIDGEQFYNMQEVSSLSKSLYETFAASTKKVRILCHPDLVHQITDLGKSLDKIIQESFR